MSDKSKIEIKLEETTVGMAPGLTVPKKLKPAPRKRVGGQEPRKDSGYQTAYIDSEGQVADIQDIEALRELTRAADDVYKEIVEHQSAYIARAKELGLATVVFTQLCRDGEDVLGVSVRAANMQSAAPPLLIAALVGDGTIPFELLRILESYVCGKQTIEKRGNLSDDQRREANRQLIKHYTCAFEHTAGSQIAGSIVQDILDEAGKN